MNKQMYKELLAKELNNSLRCKEIVKKLIEVVNKEPNDMTLGNKIRSYVNSLDVEKDE